MVYPASEKQPAFTIHLTRKYTFRTLDERTYCAV